VTIGTSGGRVDLCKQLLYIPDPLLLDDPLISGATNVYRSVDESTQKVGHLLCFCRNDRS